MIRQFVRDGIITLPFQTVDPRTSIRQLKQLGHIQRPDIHSISRGRSAVARNDRRTDGHQIQLSELETVGRNPERVLDVI